MSTGPSAFAAAGVVLDIAGALLLALGLVFKKPDQTVIEASSGYGGLNFDLEMSLARQTADAQVGAALLIAGFLVQLVAALGWHPKGWTATLIAVGTAAAIDCLAMGLLRRWRKRRVRATLAVRLRRHVDVGLWWTVLSAYGASMGYTPEGGDTETIAGFGERVLGARRWTKLRRDLPGGPWTERRQ